VVVPGSIRLASAAAVATVAAVLVAVPGLAFASSGDSSQNSGPGAGPGGVLVPDTTIGAGRKAPLTAADRDFVARVRLAGLWEMPAGVMAMQKGVNPRVREIGRIIAEQHVTLDQLDRTAAAQLGLKVPNQPNADQQQWLDEMRRAQGADFDRVFVDRLRNAHGAIFASIALIRADTRNDVVRDLAQAANQFVMTHMTLLESTNLVDYRSLPWAPDPAPLHLHQLTPVESRSDLGGASPPVIWAVLGAGLLAGTAALVRVLRPR
jgi:predicted outer membrane protein